MSSKMWGQYRRENTNTSIGATKRLGGSLSYLEGGVEDLLQWRAKQLETSQKLREEERKIEEQARRKWLRKTISKRASRFVVCIATCVVTCFIFTFEQPYLTSYSTSLEDFQQRVLKGGGIKGGVEPSIVQICRQINEIAESRDSKADGAPEKVPRKLKTKVVQETVHVCNSQSLFESMLTIYHSAVMVQTLNELGMGGIVQYNHDCHRFIPLDIKDDVTKTVQMDAPHDLLHLTEAALYRVQQMENGVTPVDIESQCSSIVQQYEEKNCATLDIELMTDEETDIMIEFMSQNADYAAMSGSPPVGAKVLNPPDANISGDDLTSIIIPDDGEKPESRKLLANDKTDAPSHDGKDVVFIYLDSHDTRGIPLHQYALHIPRSATNVVILTAPDLPRASNAIQHATKAHVSFLLGYIKELVPRARVEVSTGERVGTLGIVREILDVGTLICPPGLDCLIPALLRRAGGEGEFQRQRTVMVDSVEDKKQKSSSEPSWNISHLSPRFTNHIQILPSSSAESLDVRWDKSLHNSKYAFLTSPPDNRASCPAVRGRHGTWIKDMEFAAKLQYSTPVDHIFGFADQRFLAEKKSPYRAPTTYRWVEDKSLESCPINLVNLESFCEIMADLNVGRLFFVGDYVGMNQAYSLWKLLGNEDSPKAIKDREPGWTRDVLCPHERIVQIQFTRNDVMQENERPVDLPKKVSNCNGYLYCYGWTEKYMEYYQQEQQTEELRTIFITSFGPHFYLDNDFKNRMGDFLNVLDGDLKERLTKDIFFYRTIAPGHEFCNRKKNQNPFNNFEEYRPTITDLYSWDLHDGFNDIAERMVRDFNDAHYNNITAPTPETALLAPVHILDVYPMSVLRRDGHIGGPDCDGCSIKHDCFHYSLPGPSDWWNHLLFSNLEDIAFVEKKFGHQQQEAEGEDVNALLYPYVAENALVQNTAVAL